MTDIRGLDEICGTDRRLAARIRKLEARAAIKHAGATFADPGLTPKQLRECRMIRDAEGYAPGIVRRTLDEMVSEGREPTRPALYEALRYVVANGRRGRPYPGGAA